MFSSHRSHGPRHAGLLVAGGRPGGGEVGCEVIEEPGTAELGNFFLLRFNGGKTCYYCGKSNKNRRAGGPHRCEVWWELTGGHFVQGSFSFGVEMSSYIVLFMFCVT